MARMSPTIRPLLARLRRRRALWVVAVFVLVMKLVGGSLCMADGLKANVASASATSVAVSIDASPTLNDDDGDCVLGEGAGCHCSCVHASPIPVAASIDVGLPRLATELPTVPSTHVPAPTHTLLRPPIA